MHLKFTSKDTVLKIFLFLIIILGFFFRIFGLQNNHSFWSDENHAAIFSRAILERGRPVLANGYSTGNYQLALYYQGAVTTKLLGLNEFGLRFGSVIFGTLTIILTTLVANKIFDRRVALLTAFLMAFLEIEILNSRQFRPYQALQLFYLFDFYLLYFLSKSFSWLKFFFLLASLSLACLFHGTAQIAILSSLIVLVVINLSKIIHFVKKHWPITLGLSLFFAVMAIWSFQINFLDIKFAYDQILAPVIFGTRKANNLFYYLFFLGKNYFFINLFMLIGGISLLAARQFKLLAQLTVFIVIQYLVAAFLIYYHYTRYVYPVFPLIIILASFGVMSLSAFLSPKINFKKEHVFFILGLAFILLARNKIVFFPRSIYSLNADMQEVPEVDWKMLYTKIGWLKKENPGLKLASNWSDQTVWYLGEGSLDYVLRKPDFTPTYTKEPFSGAPFIRDLESFKKIAVQNAKLVVVLDSWDEYAPQEIKDYVEKEFKREMEIDRLYLTQPRYWPITVYSKGI